MVVHHHYIQSLCSIVSTRKWEGIRKYGVLCEPTNQYMMMRYHKVEISLLDLVYASQRARHYFLMHQLHLMVKTKPIQYLLIKPILFGKLAKYSLQLSKSYIKFVIPSTIKGQVAINMLATFFKWCWATNRWTNS